MEQLFWPRNGPGAIKLPVSRVQRNKRNKNLPQRNRILRCQGYCCTNLIHEVNRVNNFLDKLVHSVRSKTSKAILLSSSLCKYLIAPEHKFRCILAFTIYYKHKQRSFVPELLAHTSPFKEKMTLKIVYEITMKTFYPFPSKSDFFFFSKRAEFATISAGVWSSLQWNIPQCQHGAVIRPPGLHESTWKPCLNNSIQKFGKKPHTRNSSGLHKLTLAKKKHSSFHLLLHQIFS